MKKVRLYNNISKAGLDVFDAAYEYGADVENPEAILVRSAKLHDVVFGKELACIARAGAGYNNIPVDRCSEEGIVVFNTPGANANAVKELVIGGMLIAARDVVGGIEYARTLAGNPDALKEVEANKARFAGYELAGKTLVVIGLGAIGGPLANLCVRMGMKVIGYDPYVSVNAAWMLNSQIRHGEDLLAALAEADYVTVHIPLMPSTRGFLGEKEFAAVKPGCTVLNFARDGIVDSKALLEAMADGRVGKYVTDFPEPDLIGKPGVIAIPHLGASTEESEDNCARMAAGEIRAFLERGVIEHSVNYPDCDMGQLVMPARLVVMHKNVPAMVGAITGALGKLGINIETMNNRSRKDLAVTILDVSEVPTPEDLAALEATEGIIRTRVIEK